MLRKINFKEFAENIKNKVSGIVSKKSSAQKGNKTAGSSASKAAAGGVNIPQEDMYSAAANNPALKIKEDNAGYNRTANIPTLAPLGDMSDMELKPLGNDLPKTKIRPKMRLKISFTQIIKDLFTGLVVAVCAIAIGLLLAESYITKPAPWFAWLAFIPFVIAIFNIRSAFFSLVFGWLIGGIFYFVSIYWISTTVLEGTANPALANTSLTALSALLAVQFSLFALGAYYLKRMPFAWPLSVACLWVGLEILHQLIALKFMAFPWFVLGYTQFNFIYLIQISSFAGAYGVSFIVVFCSLTAGFLFLNINRLLKSFYFVLACCLMLFTLSFSHKVIKDQLNYMHSSPNTLRVALMQPYTHKLMVEGHYEDVAFTIAGLIEGLKGKKSSLVIWPESSLPGDLLDNEYMDYIVEQSGELKASQIFGGTETVDGEDYVAAVLVDGTGILDDYKKTKLVPYGEFLPFKGILGGYYEANGVTALTGTFKEGTEPGKVFNILTDISTKEKGKDKTKKEEISFGVEICFESIFPSIYRKQALSGADFFVNISNDAWFTADGPAAYQHLRANVFRAVENRRPLLRSTNTGISAWIDSLGRIRYSTELDKQESSVFNFIFNDRDAKTFYTSHGDIFAYICLVFSLTLVITGIVFLGGTRDDY